MEKVVMGRLSTRRRRLALGALAAFLGLAALVAGHDHAFDAGGLALLPITAAEAEVSDSPLVLAKQGSFFVGGENIAIAFPTAAQTRTAGHISAKGMYVQYQVPRSLKQRAYPVVLVHGSGHTGKTYEETPDGRPGWAELFVRHGLAVYVVDHSGRARSGFDPSPINRAKLEGDTSALPSLAEFTNEQAWTGFRFGPTAFVPHEHTQFPVEARDQYFAQIVPNTETTLADAGQSTVAALAALLDRIGPAIVIVHSQSGAYGIDVAQLRPALVKALISIEPRSCSLSDEAAGGVFATIPVLTVFGDFFDTDVADWPGRMRECIDTVRRIEVAGGTAENVHLPQLGIRGNSHMMMMDRNNAQVADLVLQWLERTAFRRR
jgi:pimeloyl-ACP methyl ester carboxylesterase